MNEPTYWQIKYEILNNVNSKNLQKKHKLYYIITYLKYKQKQKWIKMVFT